jgi:hypothetical protein
MDAAARSNHISVLVFDPSKASTGLIYYFSGQELAAVGHDLTITEELGAWSPIIAATQLNTIEGSTTTTGTTGQLVAITNNITGLYATGLAGCN